MEASTVIGLDLGDKYTHACVLDAKTAKVVGQERLRTTPGDVARFFEGRATARVVMEAGTHSNWMHDKIASLGFEVAVEKGKRRGVALQAD